MLQSWEGCCRPQTSGVRRTPHDGSGTGHGWITEGELLKMKKIGQFPDDPVKIKDKQIHYVNTQTYLYQQYQS